MCGDISMSEAGGQLVCRACGFQLRVGRMNRCPQCGAALQASSSPGDLVGHRPSLTTSITDSSRPPDQPAPATAEPTRISLPDQPRAQQDPGPRPRPPWGRLYAVVRFIAPGIVAILAGMVMLFRANLADVGRMVLLVGFGLTVIGVLVWPRKQHRSSVIKRARSSR